MYWPILPLPNDCLKTNKLVSPCKKTKPVWGYCFTSWLKIAKSFNRTEKTFPIMRKFVRDTKMTMNWKPTDRSNLRQTKVWSWWQSNTALQSRSSTEAADNAKSTQWFHWKALEHRPVLNRTDILHHCRRFPQHFTTSLLHIFRGGHSYNRSFRDNWWSQKSLKLEACRQWHITYEHHTNNVVVLSNGIKRETPSSSVRAWKLLPLVTVSIVDDVGQWLCITSRWKYGTTLFWV